MTLPSQVWMSVPGVGIQDRVGDTPNHRRQTRSASKAPVFSPLPPGIASRRSGASNGPTEAINGVIETTRRIARGFRNFTNYRLRCLLAAGGHRPYRIKQTNHA
jgi:hypothetical protein